MNRTPLAAALAMFLLSHSVLAEDTDIKIVNWVDHFTYGAVNTAMGIPIALVGIGYNLAQKNKVKFYWDSSGQQIVIKNGGLTLVDHSIGAFHYSAVFQPPKYGVSVLDEHEAGHSKQSGVLGPAYAPLIGLTYLIQGFDEGVMEKGADRAGNLGGAMVNRRPVSLELQHENRNGNPTDWIGVRTSVIDRLANQSLRFNGTPNPTRTGYRYGQMAAYAGTHSDGCTGTPVRLEAQLFAKDFLAQWGEVFGKKLPTVNALIESKQDTGKVSWAADQKRLNATLLSQKLGFGVRIGQIDRLALDVIGKGSVGLKGIWFPWSEPGENRSLGLTATGGVGGELRAHVLDKAEGYLKKEIEWGRQGYRREIDTIGIQTPEFFKKGQYTQGSLYHPEARSPVQFYGAVEQITEKETLPNPGSSAQVNHIKTTSFSLGGRW